MNLLRVSAASRIWRFKSHSTSSSFPVASPVAIIATQCCGNMSPAESVIDVCSGLPDATRWATSSIRCLQVDALILLGGNLQCPQHRCAGRQQRTELLEECHLVIQRRALVRFRRDARVSQEPGIK